MNSVGRSCLWWGLRLDDVRSYVYEYGRTRGFVPDFGADTEHEYVSGCRQWDCVIFSGGGRDIAVR